MGSEETFFAAFLSSFDSPHVLFSTSTPLLHSWLTSATFSHHFQPANTNLWNEFSKPSVLLHCWPLSTQGPAPPLSCDLVASTHMQSSQLPALSPLRVSTPPLSPPPLHLLSLQIAKSSAITTVPGGSCRISSPSPSVTCSCITLTKVYTTTDVPSRAIKILYFHLHSLYLSPKYQRIPISIRYHHGTDDAFITFASSDITKGILVSNSRMEFVVWRVLCWKVDI